MGEPPRGKRGDWQYLVRWHGLMTPGEPSASLPCTRSWGEIALKAVRGQIERYVLNHLLDAGEKATEAELKERVDEFWKPWETTARYHAGLLRTNGHGALLKMLAVICSCADSDLKERHPRWLNCRNGTVNLETGLIKPHDPKDMITYCVDINCNRDAKCPRFGNLALRMYGGRQDVTWYLLKTLGYAVQGENPEQIIFVNGPTSSGKAQVLHIVCEILGLTGPPIRRCGWPARPGHRAART